METNEPKGLLAWLMELPEEYFDEQGNLIKAEPSTITREEWEANLADIFRCSNKG